MKYRALTEKAQYLRERETEIERERERVTLRNEEPVWGRDQRS